MKQSIIAASMAVLALLTLVAFYVPQPAPLLGGPIPITSASMDINQPGSYCLTGNLIAGPADTGISVLANDVVIDLGGFTLDGSAADPNASGIGGAGINVVVRNGTIKNWGGFGIVQASSCRVQDVYVRGCGQSGIKLGALALVENCGFRWNEVEDVGVGSYSAVRNCQVFSIPSALGVNAGKDSSIEEVQVYAALDAFKVGEGSRVDRCSAVDFVGRGFVAEEFCSITNSTARSSHPEVLTGIYAAANSEVRHCIAEGSLLGGIQTGAFCNVSNSLVVGTRGSGIVVGGTTRVTDCSANGCNTEGERGGAGIVASIDPVIRRAITRNNNGYGIRIIGGGGQIEACTSVDNAGAGIFLQGEGSVLGNFVTDNGGIGILCQGAESVIRDNQVDRNADGIVVGGHTSLITGNRAAHNLGVDFDILWGNALGPLLNPEAQIQDSKPQANYGRD